MKTSSLYVTRDDEMYDTKSGFETYYEANVYREECQRSWINHADYVFLITRDSAGNFVKETNLTKQQRKRESSFLKKQLFH